MKLTRRLFIALALPESWRRELALGQEQLASRRDRVNWVRPEHLHLTLRFLGDTEEERISHLDAALEELAARQRAPRLVLGEPGFFGPPSSPRVLWVGVRGELDKVKTLVHQMERALKALGFPAADHAFKAHLSLGRVKRCREDLAVAHLRHPPLPLEARLERMELVESHLRPEGPEYHVLTRHILSS